MVTTPEPDPELRESALIESYLTDPANAGIRSLRLCLTDFHHSARRAAVALSRRRWEHLTTLWFGYEFEYLYEDAITSTGRRLSPLDYLGTGFVGDASDAMWRALPALQTVTIEGGLLFDTLSSNTVTHLRLRGPVGSDGSLFPAEHLPALTTLELQTACDVFGTAIPVEQLQELTPSALPSLQILDLSNAEFDDDPRETLATMPLTKQLSELRLRPMDDQA
ncbi:hypothetical protein [Actinoplanes couchii]|uniref:Leucine-rich repeat domain-containing protein n=1 Tax=Actinoplanes couchii TaxID=403638 RepID=A0ABQ3XLX0_9ACTN|nr:hypothetical protein [Actinoplanes couchii]MDR6319284.1 hypothetical protein [Actinoplanes couchii]GID59507.1 hypothetical protein Aco03nite_079110 [Actinoplanes couchii]